MPINTAGAKAILDIITTHPALYAQDEWAVTDVGDNNGYQEAAMQGLTAQALLELDREHNDSEHNECRTTFCVAGWGTLLSGYTVYRMPLGKFAVEFGTDTVQEIFANEPHLVKMAKEADYQGLTRAQPRMVIYRDPNGQWVHNEYGPSLPPFADIGAKFLGLDGLHGAYLANRLFRAEAPREEVIDALTALSKGVYPARLVEHELSVIDKTLELLDELSTITVPLGTQTIPENDPDKELETFDEAYQDLAEMRRQANALACKIRNHRRMYSTERLSRTAEQPDLTATISL